MKKKCVVCNMEFLSYNTDGTKICIHCRKHMDELDIRSISKFNEIEKRRKIRENRDNKLDDLGI